MLLLALKIAFALLVPTLLAVAVDRLLRRVGYRYADEPTRTTYRASEDH